VLRALARYQPGSETFPSPEDLHQAHVDAKRTQHQLHRLEHSLRQFSSDDRALLMMYYYEELSFRSMARRLWKSEATVRRKVHAAE
jgi:DNA-directed RNA polymerase specialized sigma24 family protein